MHSATAAASTLGSLTFGTGGGFAPLANFVANNLIGRRPDSVTHSPTSRGWQRDAAPRRAAISVKILAIQLFGSHLNI